jgi:hypothetical protein
MKDSMVIGIIILVAGVLLYATFRSIKTSNEMQSNKVVTCRPYSVLTSYELDDKIYVVCGNKEHRVIQIPVEKE